MSFVRFSDDWIIGRENILFEETIDIEMLSFIMWWQGIMALYYKLIKGALYINYLIEMPIYSTETTPP